MYAFDDIFQGNWSLKLNAEPDALVTAAQAKLVARISIDTDDTFVTGLIAAATQYAERIQGRQLMSASYTLRMDCFPDEIYLPRPPLRTFGTITYVAPDGTSTLLDSSEYQVDQFNEPARIIPAFGGSWPATQAVQNAVTIAYTAGYQDSGSVPVATVQAVLLKVRQLYDGEQLEGSPLDATIDRLLQLNKVPAFW